LGFLQSDKNEEYQILKINPEKTPHLRDKSWICSNITIDTSIIQLHGKKLKDNIIHSQL